MTIKDVAKHAEVSVSAVSRYFNGGSLSADKAARIREAIAATGYRPNPAAQTLRSGAVRQVGIVVPRIHSQSMSQVVSGITTTLDEQGYMTVLGNTNQSDEKELAYLEVMQENQVSGIILLASFLTSAKADVYRACRVPLVITGQNYPGFPCICHDDFNAVRELTARMLAKGRKRLCYIGVTEKDAAAGLARRRGAQAALEEAGLDGNALLRRIGGFNLDSGYSLMLELLDEVPDLDGVVCATDRIAQGAMTALREQGRRIPEDVSIAGVGDNWADTVSSPQLTTARLYHVQCGVEAARLLLQMIDSDAPEPVRQIQLGYTIVERGSL